MPGPGPNGALANIERIAQLQLIPSSLRPPCPSEERIFQWRGINSPPQGVLHSSLLRGLADKASRASLRDPGGYGAGLRKFHIFCDIFSVPEQERLPASFAVLHSFALWASADPDPLDPLYTQSDTPFEPVATVTTRKYLAAVRAWHIAQGWPPPLSKDDFDRINWSLRGLDRMQAGKRSRPPRPPITLPMLSFLRAVLQIDTPFDACIWALATCAFWGMMRFGEVSVHARSNFSPRTHVCRKHVIFATDLDNRPYAKLLLPAAKTAKPGEFQEVFITPQGSLCPMQALRNLAAVVPAAADDPLFSWRDTGGEIRPMVRGTALDHINRILCSGGFGNAFGHSFRIGGASFLLGQGVDSEVVRIAGRWKSLAYETYIRAFEQVINTHTAGLSTRYVP
uniref:Non-specific serine/threonine protein kinase (EC) n=1 Tax=Ganoderma boninense TaxID=34458 RepID=A0A5K1K5U2_9APHY|nr:Non-specific serine/threonine protein kinase (EC [Ganoderma boninense]